jgi:hypothetical protein
MFCLQIIKFFEQIFCIDTMSLESCASDLYCTLDNITKLIMLYFYTFLWSYTTKSPVDIKLNLKIIGVPNVTYSLFAIQIYLKLIFLNFFSSFCRIWCLNKKVKCQQLSQIVDYVWILEEKSAAFHLTEKMFATNSPNTVR